MAKTKTKTKMPTRRMSEAGGGVGTGNTGAQQSGAVVPMLPPLRTFIVTRHNPVNDEIEDVTVTAHGWNCLDDDARSIGFYTFASIGGQAVQFMGRALSSWLEINETGDTGATQPQ